MDSGKPIKESRDVDVPLAANHFWYYAGWADKLDYAFPGRVAKPLGVAAQIIPWNFPLLMLAWKIAPALPPATRSSSSRPRRPRCRLCCSPTSASRPTCRRAPSTSSRDPARSGCPRHPPRRRQGRVHRLDRDRQEDRPRRGRHRQGPDPRARRQGREHRVRRRPARPGRRGHRQRHLLQPGRGVLRGLAAARPGVDRRARSSTSSRTGSRRSASATRSTRTPTSGRSTRRRSSRRSPSSSRPASPRAPTCTSRPATCPTAATSSARRCSRTSPRATASPARRSSGRCSRC